MLANIVEQCLDPLFHLRFQNDNILVQSLILTQNTLSCSLETKLSQLQPETILDTKDIPVNSLDKRPCFLGAYI